MPSPDHPTPNWVDIAFVAKHLKISERTVERAITDGELPAYRFGKKLIRLDLNEVDAIMAGAPVHE